jgi:hypothetical protein
MARVNPSVYIESTIPSFIVGEGSPIVVTAGRQITTRRWWNERRGEYRLYVSRLVRDEISRGKSERSRERLALLRGLPQLEIDAPVERFARELHGYLALPKAAEADAVHLAAASHYRMDYLLTWNLKHIANGRVRRAIEHLSSLRGIYFPTICTPDELLGLEDEYD